MTSLRDRSYAERADELRVDELHAVAHWCCGAALALLNDRQVEELKRTVAKSGSLSDGQRAEIGEWIDRRLG